MNRSARNSRPRSAGNLACERIPLTRLNNWSSPKQETRYERQRRQNRYDEPEPLAGNSQLHAIPQIFLSFQNNEW